MSPGDERLVAALVLLGDRLPPVVDEVLAGRFDADERRELALVLATIAADLDPDLLMKRCEESVP